MYLRHVPECLQFQGGTGIRAAEPDPCITYCWGMPQDFDQALIEVSALAGVCLREEVFPAEGKLSSCSVATTFSQPGFLLSQRKELSKPGHE